jgi:hypothetical protein
MQFQKKSYGSHPNADHLEKNQYLVFGRTMNESNVVDVIFSNHYKKLPSDKFSQSRNICLFQFRFPSSYSL